MYDAIDVLSLPEGADLYAGYRDGNWPNFDAVVARFPDKPVVGITTNPADDEGTCLDVETGDANPVDAPPWVLRRRDAGVDPSCYCNLITWPWVKQAFTLAGVAEPHWWIAAVPGIGAALYPGSVAHQYAQGGNGSYDISVVADYWPGIDPVQTPTWEEDSVILLDRHVYDDGSAQVKILAVGAGGNTPEGHLLYINMKDNDAAHAQVTDVTAAIAGNPGNWQLIVAP